MTDLLANILALLHGFVVLPLFIFAPIVFWSVKKRLVWLEISYVITVGAAVGGFLWTRECILSRWEVALRQIRHPEVQYDVGFVRFLFGQIGINWPETWTLYSGIALIIFGLGGLLYRIRTNNKNDEE